MVRGSQTYELQRLEVLGNDIDPSLRFGVSEKGETPGPVH